MKSGMSCGVLCDVLNIASLFLPCSATALNYVADILIFLGLIRLLCVS